ncbi:MAG: pyridoxamine 5'-phosphate oxidase [Cyclobacteriaceae bacterium]
MKTDVASLRNEYLKSSLADSEILADPIAQFTAWFEEAVKSEQLEPNAMILGTVDGGGQPHQRTVLLKGFDSEGFVFYTNYKSNKGLHVEKNPKVNLLFPWYHLQRQVIVCGRVTKISTEESHDYFQSRPRGSQLSAYVSNQSEVIPSRQELEAKLKRAENDFNDQAVPHPAHWGGYLVVPVSFEFWQGRESRLHDRFYFQKEGTDWKISRLSP